MSGNCATGMRLSEISPASVMTMAMTTASRGRSIKTAEIMAYLPAGAAAPLPAAPGGGAPAGAGLTTTPGRTRWMPSAITCSPSASPPVTTASEAVDWPSSMRRCCALFSASTT